MNNNRIEVRNKIRQHILDCVTDENDNYYTNYGDACRCLKSEFDRVSNHQLRFAEYMRGIPFGFVYYFDDIIQFLHTLDLDNIKSKISTNDKAEMLYYNLIYREMIKVK